MIDPLVTTDLALAFENMIFVMTHQPMFGPGRVLDARTHLSQALAKYAEEIVKKGGSK